MDYYSFVTEFLMQYKGRIIHVYRTTHYYQS